MLGVNFKDKNKAAKKFMAEFGNRYHILGEDIEISTADFVAKVIQ